MTRTTFRRDKLRRLAEQGKLVLVSSYEYDDMSGLTQQKDVSIPVAISPSDFRERKEGIAYIHPSDFDTVSGRARKGDNGTIHLKVHGNCYYDFRIVE